MIIIVHWISDEEIIKDRMKRVVAYNQMISIEQPDFVFFPKKYFEIDFDSVDDISRQLPISKGTIYDVVLSITSNEINLPIINNIIKVITNKYNKGINIIYGFNMDVEIVHTKIEFFIINWQTSEGVIKWKNTT